jgi:hypothetical protein
LTVTKKERIIMVEMKKIAKLIQLALVLGLTILSSFSVLVVHSKQARAAAIQESNQAELGTDCHKQDSNHSKPTMDCLTICETISIFYSQFIARDFSGAINLSQVNPNLIKIKGSLVKNTSLKPSLPPPKTLGPAFKLNKLR